MDHPHPNLGRKRDEHPSGDAEHHHSDPSRLGTEVDAPGQKDHSQMDHGGHHDHHAMMVKDFKRRFWVSLVLTVPVLALSPMLREWVGLEPLAFAGAEWILAGLTGVVYVYGGWPFLTGMTGELKKRQPGMMTLVAVAITVAFVYSLAVVAGLIPGKLFFWETVTLIDLMLVGHWIEMRSVMGASRALEELAALVPSEAHRLTERGDTEDVPVASLRAEDRVVVRAHEQIPADGRIVEGETEVNEAALTGESRPVPKRVGDDVIAGSLNGAKAVTLEVEKTGEDAYLAQVVRLVREAQDSKSRAQDLANRAAFFLTVVALSVGALTFLGWLLLSGAGLTYAVERAVTVMVIACPHALGLAIPLVAAVSTSLGAQRGILVRDRAAFEQARLVNAVVFDKTGTLTEGRFGVTTILPTDGRPEADLLALAAAVERGSEHPIAAGVVASAEREGVETLKAEGVEGIAGKGVRGTVNGREVQILSPGAAEAAGVTFPASLTMRTGELGRAGETVVYVLDGGTPVGALALADVVRETSREAVAALHAMGIETVMLTGDKHEVAEHVARQIGIDTVIAEVLPNEKEARVRELKAQGKTVAMTGDGVNDAPALARADVGIAVGAGTDVAIETADVVLTNSDPRDVVDVLRLSRATYAKMVQNLWYAAGYNIVAIPLAAGALAWAGIVLSPAVGAVLMSLSTVVVAFNARRLRLDP